MVSSLSVEIQGRIFVQALDFCCIKWSSDKILCEKRFWYEPLLFSPIMALFLQYIL